MEKIAINKNILTFIDLNSSQKEAFLRFAKSPYFNSSNALIKLCELLNKQVSNNYPKYNNSFLARRVNVQEGSLKNLFTQLGKLLIQFMAVEDFSSQSSNSYLGALSFMDTNANYHLAKKTDNSLQQVLVASNFTNESSFKLAQYNHSYLQMIMGRVLSDQVSGKIMGKSLERLTEYYLVNQYYLSSEYIKRKEAVSDTSYLVVKEKLNEWKEVKQSSLAELYRSCIILNEGANHKLYDEVKLRFWDNINSYPRVDAQNLLLALLNYCTRYRNQGLAKFKYEYFENVKLANLHNMVSEISGVVNVSLYENAVYAGLSVNEAAWTIKFIEKHSKNLLGSNLVFTLNFTLALVENHKGDINQCLGVLEKTKASTLVQKIKKSRLILKATLRSPLIVHEDIFYANYSYLEALLMHKDNAGNKAFKAVLNFADFLYELKKAPNKRIARKELKERMKAISPIDRDFIEEILEGK